MLNVTLDPEDIGIDSEIELTVSPLKKYKFAVPRASVRRSVNYRGNWQREIHAYRDPTFYKQAATYVCHLNNVSVSQALFKAKNKFKRKYRRIALEHIQDKVEGHSFHYEQFGKAPNVEVIDNVITRTPRLTYKQEVAVYRKEVINRKHVAGYYETNEGTVICKSRKDVWFECYLTQRQFWYNDMTWNEHYDVFPKHIKQIAHDDRKNLCQKRQLTSKQIKKFKLRFGLIQK